MYVLVEIMLLTREQNAHKMSLTLGKENIQLVESHKIDLARKRNITFLMGNEFSGS